MFWSASIYQCRNYLVWLEVQFYQLLKSNFPEGAILDSAVEKAFQLSFIKKMFSCGLAEAVLAVYGKINSIFKNIYIRSFLSPTFWLLPFRNFSLSFNNINTYTFVDIRLCVYEFDNRLSCHGGYSWSIELIRSVFDVIDEEEDKLINKWKTNMTMAMALLRI